MNRKSKKIFHPNVHFYLILFVVFGAAMLLLSEYTKQLAIIELCVAVLLYVFHRLTEQRRNRQINKYIESVMYDADVAAKDSLVNFPMPMVVFGLEENRIIRANDSFLDLIGGGKRFFEVLITDAVPDFPIKWLVEGKSECPTLVRIGDRRFRVYGGIVRSDSGAKMFGHMATTYWVDVTDYADTADEYLASRPVFSIIMHDNYDEMIKGLSDKDKSATLSEIDERISHWAEGHGGYLHKYDRDRYLFVFEERYLQGFVDDKFSLLDSVRAVTSPTGIQATISIGVGKDGKDLAECFQFASLGIDMALSRGGDQAVIKNRFNFEFYGGRTSQVEKRTKVKSRVMANSLSELIRDSSEVFVMGHKHSDLDSIGAAVGICCAARKLGKPAYIVTNMETTVSGILISRMQTLPEYASTFISEEEAMLRAKSSSLLIVVDTNRPEQVESEALLLSVNQIAVIDHHRRAASFIQNAALSFHEPYASSASELVSELLQYIVDQSDMLRYEAEALLCGIVLDTKSFTLRTGGRTFDAAAFLRRAGADTADVKKLMQNDLKTAMSKFAIIQKARVYKAGIAIAAPDQAENRIIAAQAADEMLNISGIRASFVVFPEDEKIVISARAIDEINVQVIVERLGGGGNKSQAGAQITGKSHKDVVRELLLSIDKYLEDTGM